MSELKAFTKAEIEDEAKGIVTLVFARYNEIDSDGDVTLPGAFEDGFKMPVSAYGHGSTLDGRIPVGAGTIIDKPKEAWARAKFFLDTPDGAATFRTIKRLHSEGINQEWSYGYEPKDYSFGEFEGRPVRFLKRQLVTEISPVLQGAGTTRTVGVKQAGGDKDGGKVTGYKGLIRPHETDTVDVRWNPADVTEHLGLMLGVDRLRAMHAWVDPNGDPETKSSYALMHHDQDGKANVRACLIGIAALNGAKAAASIPDDARDEVYAHLASHLHDADHYVPELRAAGSMLKLNDEAMAVLADLSALRLRAAEVGASRALKGERLTKSTVEVLSWLDEELREIRSLVDGQGSADITAEWLRFEAARAGYKRKG